MLYKGIKIRAIFVALFIICLSGIAYGNEALPEAVAEELGVSADIGRRFETLYKYSPTAVDREKPDEEYYRIITAVSYAHAGEDVHVWKMEFVEGYSVSGHTINLYLDTDNDINTGRQRNNPRWDGIDVQCALNNSIDAWRVFGYCWDAGGTEGRLQTTPVFVADGNAVYCRYDAPMYKRGSQFMFRYRLTSEAVGKTVDQVDWQLVRTKVLSEGDDTVAASAILAYPNPFSDQIEISWSSEEVGVMRVMIFNEEGNVVWDETATFDTSGYQSIYWDGYHKNGTPLPMGIYHCLVMKGGKEASMPLFRGTLVKAQ